MGAEKEEEEEGEEGEEEDEDEDEDEDEEGIDGWDHREKEAMSRSERVRRRGRDRSTRITNL